MATVKTQTAVVTRGNDVEAGVVTGRVLNIKETGTPTNIPGNLYGDSNFYIRNSRDYVGGRPITTYVYFYFMPFIYLAVVIASLLSPLNFILAIVCLVLNIIFFLFYIQHMYVNIKTMRYVLKQPSLPNHTMNLNNTFLEISLEEFAVAYAATKEAGIGIVSKEKGTVKIQVFKNSTKARMKTCVFMSTVSFFLSFVLICYCVSWAIIRGIQ